MKRLVIVNCHNIWNRALTPGKTEQKPFVYHQEGLEYDDRCLLSALLY